MDTNKIAQRGKALEDLFFEKEEAKKRLEKLRAVIPSENALRSFIERGLGISDQSLVESLQKTSFDPSTVSMLFATPLIHIAWADGSVSNEEVEKVTEYLKGNEESSPLSLVANFLTERPSDSLFGKWKELVLELKENLEHRDFKTIGEAIVKQSESVAGASGEGILSFVFGKINSNESKALIEIKELLLV